jgi:two-component system, NtrC family, sensor kinase
MKIQTFFFFFHLITFGFYSSFAQETNSCETIKIDSLKNLLTNYQHDNEHKVLLMNEYAKSCFHHYNFTKGLTLTKKARNLSKILNYTNGEILYFRTMADFCYGNLSLYYQKQADWYHINMTQNKIDLKTQFKIEPLPDNLNPELLLDSLKSTRQYFINTNDKEFEAHILHLMLSVLNELGRFSESDSVQTQTLNLFTELNGTFLLFDLQRQRMEDLIRKGEIEEARNIETDLALTISETNDLKLIALMSYFMAEHYNANDRYKLAIEYFLRSEGALEELGDKELLADVYRSNGAMYENIEAYSKAFEQYSKLMELTKNKPEISRFALYAQMAYTLIPLKRYDEAKKYMELSLQGITPERENNFRARYFDALGQMLMSQGNFIEAIPAFEKSYDFFNRDSNFGTMYVNMSLSKCYRNLGNLRKSIELGLLAYNSAEINNFLSMKINSSLFLSEVYDKNGQLAQAFKFLKIHQKLKAESELLDNANNLADIEIQTVLNKSNREIEKLDKERILKIQQSKIQRVLIFSITGAFLSALLVGFILFRNNKNKQKANKSLEDALSNLKFTQSQLIQSEKMASLGELTAGIAHEIQNPLNFVNNFSEVSKELIGEMNEELAVGNNQLANEIAEDIKQNLEKINYHGKRAADIVKGMLQHSRTSSGQKEPTDVNALADEYFRLAYHGLRAKDKSFNARMNTDFDETIGNINIIPQDIGRVILNLITNAFYVVDEKKKLLKDGYEPAVSVSTKKMNNQISISVKDNGNGIPKHILDKIFQPFFTTKPTGQGTGLGLSLSYDIVKAHGGELKVETTEGKGSDFVILLPV